MKTFSETKALPPHLSEKEKVRFEEHDKVPFFIPETETLTGAWVTYSGICLKQGRIRKASVYWRAYPLIRYQLQGLLNCFIKRHVSMPGETFFIHTPWSLVNYHHWLVDCLPRLYRLTQTFSVQNLLLPEAFRQVPFVQDSLTVFGDFKIRYMQHKEIYRLERTHLVSISPGHFFLTADIRATVAAIKSGLSSVSSGKRKVYLTRRNVGYRMIENEEELCQLLVTYGFEIVEADKFTFGEQVQLFSETRLLVAVHGAAMTNCIFMPKGASVIELHPDVEQEGSIINVCYQNLCHCFGLRYFFAGCQPVNREERFHTANLTADLEHLKRLLADVNTIHNEIYG